MKSRDETTFIRIGLAYGVFSIVIAFLGPIVDIGDESIWRFSPPTVESLMGRGGNRLELSRYFTLMTLAFPVVVILMACAFPWRATVRVWKPKALVTAFGLTLVVAFMAHFTLFLPTADHWPRRTEVLFVLAANTDFGLGLVYGALFAMIAVLFVFTVVPVWDQLTMRNR